MGGIAINAVSRTADQQVSRHIESDIFRDCALKVHHSFNLARCPVRHDLKPPYCRWYGLHYVEPIVIRAKRHAVWISRDRTTPDFTPPPVPNSVDQPITLGIVPGIRYIQVTHGIEDSVVG